MMSKVNLLEGVVGDGLMQQMKGKKGAVLAGLALVVYAFTKALPYLADNSRADNDDYFPDYCDVDLDEDN